MMSSFVLFAGFCTQGIEAIEEGLEIIVVTIATPDPAIWVHDAGIAFDETAADCDRSWRHLAFDRPREDGLKVSDECPVLHVNRQCDIPSRLGWDDGHLVTPFRL